MRIKERYFLSALKKMNSFPSIIFIVLQAKWIYCMPFGHLQPKVYNSDTDEIGHPFESCMWYIMMTAHPPDNKKIVTNGLRMFIYPNNDDYNYKVHTNKLSFTEPFHVSHTALSILRAFQIVIITQ